MRITLLVMILVIGALSTHAQDEWSALFPEIPGCVKTVARRTNTNNATELTANYQAADHPCGSITLRREQNLLQNRKKWETSLFLRWVKVKSFEALESTPLCGNDDWIETVEVFFSENMSMTISAYRWHPSILDFAQKADYKTMEKQMK
jgi:hypothetical protein